MPLCEKLRKVKAVVSDVDGILNDGKIYYLPCGERIEVAKFFNVKDGLAVKLLKLANIKVGVITGRSDRVVEKRCRDLGCDFYLFGVKDKGKALREIISSYGLKREEVLYLGDDLNDLPAFEEAGVKITVEDGSEYLKRFADFVVPLKGGEGVLRFLTEEILKCQNRREEIFRQFLEFLKRSSNDGG